MLAPSRAAVNPAARNSAANPVHAVQVNVHVHRPGKVLSRGHHPLRTFAGGRPPTCSIRSPRIATT